MCYTYSYIMFYIAIIIGSYIKKFNLFSFHCSNFDVLLYEFDFDIIIIIFSFHKLVTKLKLNKQIMSQS